MVLAVGQKYLCLGFVIGVHKGAVAGSSARKKLSIHGERKIRANNQPDEDSRGEAQASVQRRRGVTIRLAVQRARQF